MSVGLYNIASLIVLGLCTLGSDGTEPSWDGSQQPDVNFGNGDNPEVLGFPGQPVRIGGYRPLLFKGQKQGNSVPVYNQQQTQYAVPNPVQGQRPQQIQSIPIQTVSADDMAMFQHVDQLRPAQGLEGFNQVSSPQIVRKKVGYLFRNGKYYSADGRLLTGDEEKAAIAFFASFDEVGGGNKPFGNKQGTRPPTNTPPPPKPIYLSPPPPSPQPIYFSPPPPTPPKPIHISSPPPPTPQPIYLSPPPPSPPKPIHISSPQPPTPQPIYLSPPPSPPKPIHISFSPPPPPQPIPISSPPPPPSQPINLSPPPSPRPPTPPQHMPPSSRPKPIYFAPTPPPHPVQSPPPPPPIQSPPPPTPPQPNPLPPSPSSGSRPFFFLSWWNRPPTPSPENTPTPNTPTSPTSTPLPPPPPPPPAPQTYTPIAHLPPAVPAPDKYQTIEIESQKPQGEPTSYDVFGRPVYEGKPPTNRQKATNIKVRKKTDTDLLDHVRNLASFKKRQGLDLEMGEDTMDRYHDTIAPELVEETQKNPTKFMTAQEMAPVLNGPAYKPPAPQFSYGYAMPGMGMGAYTGQGKPVQYMPSGGQYPVQYVQGPYG